ncbi:hypothetical protein NMY22_g5571 [Coprinellus aureogranulatus]|nr:hypothetical protein NMY22_g5571 [Coprinellus aureogranulatus]
MLSLPPNPDPDPDPDPNPDPNPNPNPNPIIEVISYAYRGVGTDCRRQPVPVRSSTTACAGVSGTGSVKHVSPTHTIDARAFNVLDAVVTLAPLAYVTPTPVLRDGLNGNVVEGRSGEREEKRDGEKPCEGKQRVREHKRQSEHHRLLSPSSVVVNVIIVHNRTCVTRERLAGSAWWRVFGWKEKGERRLCMVLPVLGPPHPYILRIYRFLPSLDTLPFPAWLRVDPITVPFLARPPSLLSLTSHSVLTIVSCPRLRFSFTDIVPRPVYLGLIILSMPLVVSIE